MRLSHHAVPDHGQLEQLLAEAETLMRSVGKTLLAMEGSGRTVEKEEGRDIKILADRVLDRILNKGLREATGIPVLSEELVDAETLNTEDGLYWVVDPMDGSMNYARGLDLCCCSVALWMKGHPLLGLIFDFNRDEFYTGMCAQGAWMNGRTIGPGSCTNAGKAVLATGFPLNSDTGGPAVTRFLDMAGRYKKVRMLGTAALSLAFVACGKVDLYWERDIMIWDVAAGLAILSAAGGTFAMRPGRTSYAYDVLAGNSTLIANEKKYHGY